MCITQGYKYNTEMLKRIWSKILFGLGKNSPIHLYVYQMIIDLGLMGIFERQEVDLMNKTNGPLKWNVHDGRNPIQSKSTEIFRKIKNHF